MAIYATHRKDILQHNRILCPLHPNFLVDGQSLASDHLQTARHTLYW